MIYAFNIDLPYGWLFILLYSFTIIPFTYAMSFLFIKENVAQTSMLLFNFFAGVVLSPVFNMLRMFDNTRTAGKVMAWFFRFFPSFNLSYGINNISYRNLYAALDRTTVEPYLHVSVGGTDIILLVFEFFLYIILIFLLEAQCFNFLLICCEPKSVKDTERSNKDSFVINEEKLCDSMSLEKNPPAVVTRHLRKVYAVSKADPIRAVKDLSFYVKKGEC
jgi:ATP-binding cassette subfamily A (ABC1) protein 3